MRRRMNPKFKRGIFPLEIVKFVGEVKKFRILIAALSCVACGVLSGQTVNDGFEHGFVAGGNLTQYSSSLDVPQVDEAFSAGPGFSAGLFLRTSPFRDFRMKAAAYYALHTGTVPSPFYRLRNQYFAGSGMLQYRIVDDLRVHAGVNYLHLFSSRLFKSQTLEEDAGNAVMNSFGFRNEINPLIGFELRMTEKSHIEVNYIHPVSDLHSRNVQVALYITIDPDRNEPTRRQLAAEDAYNQISELKNGVLLVRLATSTAKIKALKARGRRTEAEEIEAEQHRINREIIRAFRRKFDFCRVEFFLATDSRKVKEGKSEGIFLDDQLNPDSSITVNSLAAVYTAEFGSTARGTGGGVDISALVIMDRNFNMLEKPFPYYTRALHAATEGKADKVILAVPLLPFTPMTYVNTVEKFNSSLHHFYMNHRQF